MESTEAASEALDRLIQQCVVAEQEAISRDLFDRLGMARLFRAHVIVSSLAILERLFRDIGPEIRMHIVSRDGTGARLNSRLVSLNFSWSTVGRPDRDSLFARALLLSKDVASLEDWPETFSFADGRSIDGRSFVAIWAVLELDGNPFPHPSSRLILEDLARRRNKIAHGESLPDEEGRALTFGDIRQKLKAVSECVDHLDLSLDDWCRISGWRC